MHILRNTLLGAIIIFSVAASIYVFFPKSKNIPTSLSPQPLPPVQKIAEAQEKDRVVTSSDGLKSLTLKKSVNGDNTTYSFYISESTQPLFTQTLGKTQTLGIPDNAWSPGEKYVFIEENEGGQKTDLVFKTDGSVFPNGEQYLDVGKLFKEKEINYAFAKGTGWADSSLIIIESTNPDGTTGPSFWFELPYGGFIQLASHQ